MNAHVPEADPIGLSTSVVRVEESELPPGGPELAIALLAAGHDAVERYRSGGEEPLPENEPLVGLVRIDGLNSPDELRVTDAVRSGARFVLTIELRRFTGLLGANLVRTGLAEARLGPLPAGAYEVEATVVTLEFAEWGRPETAGHVSVRSLGRAFRVVSWDR